ncbi:MAG: TolB family protein [Oscillochloridaceae bacterium umkhey_bin13]
MLAQPFWSRWLKLWLVVVLVACGGDQAAPGPEPAASGPRVRGEALPGRLLFGREGVIWQWQGDEARPLFGNGMATQPAWSPTGDRIAYIERDNSFSNLILADAQGETLARLTDYATTQPPNSLERVYASRWAFYPAWHPDGMQIALAVQRSTPVGTPPTDYNLVLNLVPAGPGVARTLAADERGQVSRSVFSPDGAVVVFVRAGIGPEGRQRLYRLPMSGGEATPLAGAPEPSYDPAFSPDGVWLAFAARDGGRTDIFSLPSGGVGVPLRLTNLGAARAPAFSPDGRHLAFLATTPGEPGFDLWLADLSLAPTGALQAEAPRRLTTGLNLDPNAGLAWGP